MIKTDGDCDLLIKYFDPCSLKPYQDPAGIWTLGYGRALGRVLPDKYKNGIDKQTAEEWFQQDKQRHVDVVSSLVKVALLTPQANALVVFDFNTGHLANSTLLSYLNNMQFTKAALEFVRWDHFYNPKSHHMEESKGLYRRCLCTQFIFRGGTVKDLSAKHNWFMSVVS